MIDKKIIGIGCLAVVQGFGKRDEMDKSGFGEGEMWMAAAAAAAAGGTVALNKTSTKCSNKKLRNQMFKI